jgi:adenylosuccinate synthase
MRAVAVIGALWGDEGKGAAVDKIADSTPGALVIRFNGGAQAGHTVVTPEGKRHVFSHFCSGALAGAPGYLSEHFVVNPRIFCNELHELRKLKADKANLNISVHPNALVTTPLDVAINRFLEMKRGNSRHGSVGIGFGETIERSERGYPLYVSDLIDKENLRTKWMSITMDWSKIRLAELGFDDSVHFDKVFDSVYSDDYFEQCEQLVHYVNLATLDEVAKGKEWLIFEGAQGLLLDQKRGMTFPHVTRSNTGLQNVIPMLEKLRIDRLKAIYMIRPYLTRHGAGPLPGEGKKIPFIINDETNKHGQWQGSLRVAPTNTALITSAIDKDISDAGSFNVDPHIGISCTDQAKIKVTLNQLSDLDYTRAILGEGPSRDKYGLTSKLKGKRITWHGSRVHNEPV